MTAEATSLVEQEGDDSIGVVPFRPSDWHTQWIQGEWKITDPVADELRCLWVLERCLDARGLRFYHLPRPAPRRWAGGRGFTVAMREFGSFDASGLADLAVAAFAARVRVEVSCDYVWLDEDYEVLCWHDEIDYDSEQSFGLHEARTLSLDLSARQADGSLYDRHPGVDHIESLIAKWTSPEYLAQYS